MEKGKKNEELFCSMPVPQAILTLAVPTVVSQIITIIYNMADTFSLASWVIRSRWQRRRWQCLCLCL